MSPTVTVHTAYEALVVRINDLLHLYVPQPILGVQSWAREPHGKWQIQFTVAGGVEITSDYDNKDLWEKGI